MCTYLKLVCEELHSEGNQLEKKLKHKDAQDDKTEAMEHQPGVNARVTSNCRWKEKKYIHRLQQLTAEYSGTSL